MSVLTWEGAEQAADAGQWRAKMVRKHIMPCVEIVSSVGGAPLTIVVSGGGVIPSGNVSFEADVSIWADGRLLLTFLEYAQMQGAIQEARNALATLLYQTRGLSAATPSVGEGFAPPSSGGR